ncbi:MAG TPA: DUF3309 family protein [Xanthobacteraceae bacterium]|nr:DUF3309 family protein [Xanthobacteraceae bacterium]
MSFSTALIAILLFLFIAALPAWPYSARWGFGPGGVLGLMLALVIMLTLRGQI